MPQGIIRAAIVGASSLLGKELADLLNEAVSMQWDLKLLDNDEVAGQMAAVGDEPLVIQPVSSDSFTALEIVFFAGDASTTREYWRAAAGAGASVVDLSGALEGEENVSVRSPLVRSAGTAIALDLSSVAVVSAHPAAIMLGAVIGKLHAAFAPLQASATVLEPASQHGSKALDEMHQQTVSLLSFKSLPQEVFDSQVAFNLSTALGSASQVDLGSTEQSIRRHMEIVAGSAVAKATSMQLVQAPVFSGYTASVFIATASSLRAGDVQRSLNGDVVVVPESDDPSPSNQSAAQQGQVMVQVRPTAEGSNEPQGFWLWMAADNLRLAARNGVACAAELLALRPIARVQ